MGLLNKKSLYDLSQGRGDAGSNLEDQIGNRIEPGWDREADIGSPNGSPFRGNMREFSNTGTDDHMVHLLQGNIDSERLGDGYVPNPANARYLEKTPVGVPDFDLEKQSMYPNYDNNFGTAGSTYKDAKQTEDPNARF